MMVLSWTEHGWEDYLYWQKHNKAVLIRINKIIKDIKRNPFGGLGSPEPLKHNWQGYWSRNANLG